MADNATRAPESDAAEVSPEVSPESSPKSSVPSTPVDARASDTKTPATTGPALCDDCVSDRPTPAGHVPVGELRTLADVDVYVAKPPGYPGTAARLLLLLTGGTGLSSANNQLQADQFAAAGFVVVMPDLFGGDVAPNTALEPADAGGSFLDLFRTKAAETAKSFLIDMWLARHTEARVLPLLRRVVAAARAEFADADMAGGGVYAAGYCFGGRYVLLLAADKEGTADQPGTASAAASAEDLEAGTAPTRGPLIKAGALAHATLVSPDDFAGLQAPVSMVCVENDPMFPDAIRTAGEDYLSAHNVEHEVQVYPGVPHGFAVVGDYADANIKEAQAAAFDQMLKWLKAH